MRTKTVALAAAGALALTTVGGAFIAGPAIAAVTDAFTPAPDVPFDGPPKARADRIAEQLAPLVEDGTLTSEQAAKVGEQLAQSGPFAPGHRGPGRPGGVGPGMLHEALDTAAESLGMTVAELRTRLADGSTLGEIADAEGVGRADLVVDLVAAAKAELAERVESGDLTQERADEIAETLEERVTDSLDRSLPGHRERGDDNQDSGDS